jgi:hypothetical protein
VTKRVRKRKESDVTYFDEAGNIYTEETLPDDIKKEIQMIITRWEKGKI